MTPEELKRYREGAQVNPEVKADTGKKEKKGADKSADKNTEKGDKEK